MPRSTSLGTHLARYEEAWEAINRLIRRGGSWSGHERNCFFVQGTNGRFENASAVMGLDVPEDGRGLAVWDFDRDGDLDLILKSRNAPQVRIWRNDFQRPGNRIQIDLVGVASNRQAVGARVTLHAGGRTRVKEVCAGSGFLSQNSRILHFGLGSAVLVESLEVRWPGGKKQTFHDVPINRRLRIVEGSERIVASAFEPASRVGSAPAAASAAETPVPATTSFWLLDPCPLPTLELLAADGSPLRVDSFRGKPFLLALWSPDCPRCRSELEGWRRDRASKSGDGELAVLAVTMAPASRRLEISSLARSYGVIAALSDEASGLSLGVLLEEIGHWPREIPVPASLLIDADGRVVKLWRGAVEWSQAKKDASSLPGSAGARLAAGLPFAGRYYSTDLHRNEFQLGVSYLEAGLDAQALEAFERSLGRRPDQPDALYNTAVIHQRRGETDRAFQRYREALDLQPDFVDARANLGVLLAQGGVLDEAERAFRRVIQLRPDHAEAWINLGNVQLAGERPDEALQSFARAQSLEPELPQVQKKIGDAYRRVGDSRHALEAYAQAARLAPRDAEVWSNLGVLHAEGGQLEEALKACLRAIEVNPAYASAHNNAGLVLQGLGRNSEAIPRFERAIELAPRLPAPYLNLARTHFRQGNDAEARKVLQSLLAVSPNHPAALELLKR